MSSEMTGHIPEHILEMSSKMIGNVLGYAPESVHGMWPWKPRRPQPQNWSTTCGHGSHLRAYYAPLTRLLRAGRRHPDPGKTRVGIQDTWLPIGLLQVQLHFVLHAFILHHWPWQHQCCQLLLDSCSHVDIWWCLRVRDLRLPCSRISLGYS